jgi:hypothetical protein
MLTPIHITTRCHNPEDSDKNFYRRPNLTLRMKNSSLCIFIPSFSLLEHRNIKYLWHGLFK